MTPFDVERLPFTREAVEAWGQLDIRHRNWPVVYLLGDGKEGSASPTQVSDVYVGESRNAAARMRQHLDSGTKAHISTIRVVVDERFNKSVCLDLESYLIRLLDGDGAYRVLNRNDGITDSDYYLRDLYREDFGEVFAELHRGGMFTRSIPEIENSDLFKLSPFKALQTDQAVAVEGILEALFEDLEGGTGSTVLVQGEPGTGKTVVAIYLLKLLADIRSSAFVEDVDSDTMFSEFFAEGYPETLANFRVGLVIPQQSLRNSVEKVFKKTPGLSPSMVLDPFEVGGAEGMFDLLIVDEAHRLNQRANQPSASQNTRFSSITTSLFGFDDKKKTQLDWIRAKSRHQILMVDAAQSVRPADLPRETLMALIDTARSENRFHRLSTQMRVRADADYVGYIRRLVRAEAANSELAPAEFEGYDFRLFDGIREMRNEIRKRDEEFGLARLVAGFAWKWISRKHPNVHDIEIDGLQLRWNSTDKDWIASAKAIDEVGSVHTVQGYDLNYAGVIIGPDLKLDPATGSLKVDRSSYFDTRGKQNNPTLGKVYSDDDLLQFVSNIYAVLLTRGIRGTYVYVCDPPLREYLRGYISSSS